MHLKKALRIQNWLAGICAALVLLGTIAEKLPLSFAGLGAGFAALFVSLKYWRCPHCGGYLGRDLGQFCRHCGKELEELKEE